MIEPKWDAARSQFEQICLKCGGTPGYIPKDWTGELCRGLYGNWYPHAKGQKL